MTVIASAAAAFNKDFVRLFMAVLRAEQSGPVAGGRDPARLAVARHHDDLTALLQIRGAPQL